MLRRRRRPAAEAVPRCAMIAVPAARARTGGARCPTTTTSAATAAPVSTASAEAQLWFDRGLVLVLRLQPRGGRALLRAGGRGRSRAARWRTGASPTPPGRTTTSRGRRSTPVELATAVARAHARRCARRRRCRDGASPVERALIEALPQRYPARRPSRRLLDLERRLRRRRCARSTRGSRTTSTSRRCSPRR